MAEVYYLAPSVEMNFHNRCVCWAGPDDEATPPDALKGVLVMLHGLIFKAVENEDYI